MWRPVPLSRTLLFVASIIGSGTATAQTGAIGDAWSGEAEAMPESRSNGGRDAGAARAIPTGSALLPRWVEPRRLLPVPIPDAGEGDPSAGVLPEAAPALPDVESTVRQPLSDRDAESGSDKDWRRAARIVIHGERVNDELSALTVDLLTMLGAEEVEYRQVRDSSDADQIRYFDAADESMARELAAALEPEFGRVQIMDFTFYQPSPESGLLEMWLR